MTDAATKATSDIVARADFQYRWRVYVFFILVFGYGMWSLRDGYFVWPRENALWRQMEEHGQRPPQTEHNEASLAINQVLGVLLPAVSLPLFVWLMYRSRGEYRLSVGKLMTPGNAPVALESVRSLDKSRWDRKGIAVVEHELPGGQTGKITLRDMVYQRRATDEIVARIEAHLTGNAETSKSPLAQ